MTTVYDLVIMIVGNPVNDYQTDILYITACIMSVIIVFTFMEIVYMLAGLLSAKR